MKPLRFSERPLAIGLRVVRAERHDDLVQRSLLLRFRERDSYAIGAVCQPDRTADEDYAVSGLKSSTVAVQLADAVVRASSRATSVHLVVGSPGRGLTLARYGASAPVAPPWLKRVPKVLRKPRLK